MIAKKLLLVAAVVASCGLSQNAFAYDSSILLGPLFSHASTAMPTTLAGSYTTSMGTGFAFGSFIGGNFTERFGGEVGFIFSNPKLALHLDGVQVGAVSATALRIPLLFGVNLPNSGVKFQLGPYFGLLPTLSVPFVGTRFHSVSVDNNVEIGAMGGVTYISSLGGSVDFRASALYSFSFTDYDAESNVTFLNRDLALMVGIVIHRD